MTGTLGDCLSAAEWYFSAAEAVGVPVPGQAETVHQAQRLVAVLGRYLDMVPAGDLGTAVGGRGVREAVAGMRAGLRAAGEHLGQAMPRHGGDVLWLAEPPADPVARRYARGVDALAAGNDLLGTHMSSNAGGYPVARSDWAQVLATQPAAAAVVGEVVIWAHRAERMVDRIIDTPGRMRGLSAVSLAAARGRLAAVSRTRIPAGRAGMGVDGWGELLHAVPSAAVPPRIVPDGHEPDALLCAGIGVSARRLRGAAFGLEREPPWSPVLSGPAWQRAATAAAIVCDLSAQVTGSLADSPAASAVLSPDRLRDAAASFRTARDMWRHAWWMWQRAATDTTSRTCPVTADATDLAVRFGRLAFGDPAWTPASGNKPVTRAGEALASGPAALAAVLGAVHEAADAITRMARADFRGLGTVCRAGRLYMPAAVLGDTATARRDYVPAPDDRARILRNAAYLCADTTLRAVETLDGLALEAGTPSRALALARLAVPARGNTPEPEPDFELSPRAFADQVDLFARPSGVGQRSRVQVKPGTVVLAYSGEHPAVEEVARRYCMSVRSVTAILTAAGHQVREPGARPGQRQHQGTGASPSPRAPAREPETVSPLLRELRKRGISDPGILDRAAIIDRAAADILLNADENQARRRTAAQLAAMDGPADATQAVHAGLARSGVERESGQVRRRPRGGGQQARPGRA